MLAAIIFIYWAVGTTDYTEIYKLFINYCEKIQRQNKFNPERHFEMDVEKFSFDFQRKNAKQWQRKIYGRY